MSNSVKPKVTLKETAGSKNAAVAGSKKAAVGGQQALPPMPRKRSSKKSVPRDCACGCGGKTRGGDYIPGHDSKLKAWLLRVERGVMKISDIEHEGTRNAVKRVMKAGGMEAVAVGKKKSAVADKSKPPVKAKAKAKAKPGKKEAAAPPVVTKGNGAAGHASVAPPVMTDMRKNGEDDDFDADFDVDDDTEG